MEWKENIGNKMADKNIYRLRYLNEKYINESLIELTNYLNEFDGMQSRFEKINFVIDTKNLFSKVNIRYRLEIYYPGDEFLFGKLSDNKNRRFIADIFFNSSGLNIWVFYRRYGGAFLNSKFRQTDSTDENKTNERNINTIIKKLSDDFQKRDVYREIISMNDGINCNYLINKLIFLYEKHLENIEKFNSKSN